MRGAAALRAALYLGLPSALVLIALGYETRWGSGTTREVATLAAAGQPVPVALLPEYGIDGGIDARKETVERALFNPTRRAAPPATRAAALPSSMQKGLYTLTGTTVVGDVATAVLREVKGGASHSVRQGERLNGVLIAEVTRDSVRLSQDGDTENLYLKVATGPARPQVPVAPMPTRAATNPSGASGTPAAARPQPQSPAVPRVATAPAPAPRLPAPVGSAGAAPASGATPVPLDPRWAETDAIRRARAAQNARQK